MITNSQSSATQVQGHQGISWWVGLKLKACAHNGASNKFKVTSRSGWIGLKLQTCDHNGVPIKFKVIMAFNTGMASNLVLVILLEERRTCSRSSQVH